MTWTTTKTSHAKAAGVNLGANKGVNGACYAWFITNEVVPMVKALYNGPVKEVWQDDNAVIHR